jgi:hypothetical protein
MPQPPKAFAVDQRVIFTHQTGVEVSCVVRGTTIQRCAECGGPRYFLEQDDGGLVLSCGNTLRAQSIS